MNFKRFTRWTRFNKYLYQYWRAQTIVIVLGLVTIPLGLLNPYITKLVIDKAYGNKNLKLFFILAFIGSVVFVINGLISSISRYMSRRINRRVNFDMSLDLYKHLQFLPMSFFDNHSTGEHIFRVHSDVTGVSDFICTIVPQMITTIPRFIFIFVIVFFLNWKLALLSVLLVPLSYIHPYFFGKRIKEVTGTTVMRTQSIFKYLQEKFSHIHLIKAMGKEKQEIREFEDNLDKRIEAELKNAKLMSLSMFSGTLLTKVLGGIIALYGGYQVIQGTMLLGSFTAIMIYLTQLMMLISSVGMFYQTIIINSVRRHRLEEVFDIIPIIQDSDDAFDHEIQESRIVYDSVSFSYKKNRPVIKDLSFAVQPGEKVAIVGFSGCGKSTLISLLLRLYEFDQGVITIDGVDIKKIKLDYLKKPISLVFQESFLWNDTIANNILYGTDGATQEEMIEAAKLAQAHEFIMGLPNQYDSVIGEMACKLSEGQKQRIAVARALIKKPKILILDEAMSSLDSDTEEKVMNNIARVYSDVTMIVVSHRLSSVRKMDKILFLKDPSTIAEGTHTELLSKEPHYSELFASQIEGRVSANLVIRPPQKNCGVPPKAGESGTKKNGEPGVLGNWINI